MDRKVQVAMLLFLSLILVGTGGYSIIEGWPPIDSFYMTVIALSTVGFGEVHPLSSTGKVFTSVLIVIGVGTLAYALKRTTEAILERGLLRRRRLAMEIKRLSNHVVVCGYGRMGRVIANELKARSVPFVVVEKDTDALEHLEHKGYRFVKGDATDDNSLSEAGVERARAMATVLPNDSDNLFVTLTARNLNESLTIIARSSNPKNTKKMRTAGATRVLNPYLSGGRLIIRQLLHPSVTEFFEVISQWQETDIGLEEVVLADESPLVGVKLRDAPIRKEMDVIVVGVRGSDAGMRFNPHPDLALDAGDTLVVLGHQENLKRLTRLAEGR
jgi:voltage-gated potassium channel